MKAHRQPSESVSTGAHLIPDELALLNQGLDELMAQVSDNHLPFLGTVGHRKGFVHTAFHDLFKAMRRARSCCYPGCGDTSIIGSHTLQKSGPIRFISEADHVLTPSYATNGEGYTALKIGVNDASTFPGFCQKHEAIFDFETIGDLITDRHVELQVFRTICREVTVKQIQIAQLREVRKRHDHLVSRSGLDFLRRRLGADFVNRHGLRSLTLDHVSKAQTGMEECEREVSSALGGLEQHFLPAATKAIEGKGDQLYHVAVTVHQPLPVCLAGVANFWIDDHGRRESVRTVLNVIPSPRKTMIVATCLACHKCYLNVYMQSMLDRMNGPLILVETWMVRGTDHWFLTPSEWENIPEPRRRRILADVMDESVCIGEPYPASVLDSVRTRTLKSREAKEEPREAREAEAAKIADRRED